MCGSCRYSCMLWNEGLKHRLTCHHRCWVLFFSTVLSLMLLPDMKAKHSLMSGCEYTFTNLFCVCFGWNGCRNRPILRELGGHARVPAIDLVEDRMGIYQPCHLFRCLPLLAVRVWTSQIRTQLCLSVVGSIARMDPCTFLDALHSRLRDLEISYDSWNFFRGLCPLPPQHHVTNSHFTLIAANEADMSTRYPRNRSPSPSSSFERKGIKLRHSRLVFKNG